MACGPPQAAPVHSSKPMIRIAISIESCQALVATLPLDSAAYEQGSNAKGKRRFLLGSSISDPRETDG